MQSESSRACMWYVLLQVLCVCTANTSWFSSCELHLLSKCLCPKMVQEVSTAQTALVSHAYQHFVCTHIYSGLPRHRWPTSWIEGCTLRTAYHLCSQCLHHIHLWKECTCTYVYSTCRNSSVNDNINILYCFVVAMTIASLTHSGDASGGLCKLSQLLGEWPHLMFFAYFSLLF